MWCSFMQVVEVYVFTEPSDIILLESSIITSYVQVSSKNVKREINNPNFKKSLHFMLFVIYF